MTLMLVIFVGTLAISLLAAWHVRTVYHRFREVDAASGLTGAEVAHRMLASAGIRDVEITAEPGTLNDHYDPLHKRLVLSPDNYQGRSISAVSVAAHEAGHALQHARAYAPLQWRMAAVGAASFASQIVTWLPLLGMVTGLMSTVTGVFLMAAGWGVITLFNLVTLPVEYDASRRAKLALVNSGVVSGPETHGVNAVLNAAALTYVGALVTSLAWLFYYLLPLVSGQEE